MQHRRREHELGPACNDRCSEPSNTGDRHKEPQRQRGGPLTTCNARSHKSCDYGVRAASGPGALACMLARKSNPEGTRHLTQRPARAHERARQHTHKRAHAPQARGGAPPMRPHEASQRPTAQKSTANALQRQVLHGRRGAAAPLPSPGPPSHLGGWRLSRACTYALRSTSPAWIRVPTELSATHRTAPPRDTGLVVCSQAKPRLESTAEGLLPPRRRPASRGSGGCAAAQCALDPPPPEPLGVLRCIRSAPATAPAVRGRHVPRTSMTSSDARPSFSEINAHCLAKHGCHGQFQTWRQHTAFIEETQLRSTRKKPEPAYARCLLYLFKKNLRQGWPEKTPLDATQNEESHTTKRRSVECASSRGVCARVALLSVVVMCTIAFRAMYMQIHPSMRCSSLPWAAICCNRAAFVRDLKVCAALLCPLPLAHSQYTTYAYQTHAPTRIHIGSRINRWSV